MYNLKDRRQVLEQCVVKLSSWSIISFHIYEFIIVIWMAHVIVWRSGQIRRRLRSDGQ